MIFHLQGEISVLIVTLYNYLFFHDFDYLNHGRIINYSNFITILLSNFIFTLNL